MRGHRSSAAEIQGWTRDHDPLDPLDDYERERTVTEVGSSSVARALLAIRMAHRAGADDAPASSEPATPRALPSPREGETIPAPPQSDVREIGAPVTPEEDPLALYVDALKQPPLEIDRRLAPRPRRETVQMPSSCRLRHGTVPMLDRPLQIPARLPAPPPPAPVPARRYAGVEAMLVLSFVTGAALMFVLLLALAQLE